MYGPYSMDYYIHLGEIRHEYYGYDESLNWTISAPANCPMVHLASTYLLTRNYYEFNEWDANDHLTIAGTRYSGSDRIMLTVPASTVIYFQSDRYMNIWEYTKYSAKNERYFSQMRKAGYVPVDMNSDRTGFVIEWTCIKSILNI